MRDTVFKTISRKNGLFKGRLRSEGAFLFASRSKVIAATSTKWDEAVESAKSFFFASCS